MEVDLLEERRPLPPPGAVARRPEAIHVYGVDVLSTSDILRYFSEWGPTFVEWLDDSSANVIFADEFTAKRALVGRGKPLPPDDSAAAAEEGGDFASASASLDPTDIKNAPFLWHKGDDATKAGTGVPIVYRMATVVSFLPPSFSERTEFSATMQEIRVVANEKAGREKNSRGRERNRRKIAVAVKTSKNSPRNIFFLSSFFRTARRQAPQGNEGLARPVAHAPLGRTVHRAQGRRRSREKQRRRRRHLRRRRWAPQGRRSKPPPQRQQRRRRLDVRGARVCWEGYEDNGDGRRRRER